MHVFLTYLQCYPVSFPSEKNQKSVYMIFLPPPCRRQNPDEIALLDCHALFSCLERWSERYTRTEAAAWLRDEAHVQQW